MPHYEFFCNACQKTFSKILTISEHEKEIACRTAAARVSSSAGPRSPLSPRRKAPENKIAPFLGN